MSGNPMSDTAVEPQSDARGRWPHSSMETFHASRLPSLVEPCGVIIAGGAITVSHRDAELGLMTLRGEEVEPGHFTLHGPNGSNLTLHRFRDDSRLEGVWTDRGNTGMWTVTLSDDPEDAVA